MRKYIFAILMGLIVATPAQASLWGYFAEKGQNLPSVAARTPLADSCGISGYAGLYTQNLALETCLRAPDGFLGATLPVAGATYTLAGSGVTGSGTSITLQTLTLPQSGYELLDADFSTTFYVTLEPGSRTRQEIASCTTVTQNADNTATLSNCTRGLLPISPYTASTTFQFAHAGGTSLIFSDPPQLFNELGSLQDDETVTGEWIFGTTTSKGICFINTNFCIRSNSSTIQWSDDDWLNAYNLNTSTASALTASSTQGISIDNAKVSVKVSSTQGMAFGVDGRLYQQVSSTRGLINSSTGTYITTTANLIFNSGGALDINGSSTPGANIIPISNVSGTLAVGWIATSTTNTHQFLRSTSTGAYWSDLGVSHNNTSTVGRALNTTYQNTSTFPLYVVVNSYLEYSGTAGRIEAFVSSTLSTGLKVARQEVAAAGSGYFTISFIVPTGWYYKVLSSGGVTFFEGWYEIQL